MRRTSAGRVPGASASGRPGLGESRVFGEGLLFFSDFGLGIQIGLDLLEFRGIGSGEWVPAGIPTLGYAQIGVFSCSDDEGSCAYLGAFLGISS